MFKRGSYGAIALRDLGGAKLMLQNDRYNDAVLFAQQSLEKILKEYVQQNADAVKDVSVLHSHKLLRILQATGDEDLQVYRHVLSSITDCYYDSRYPGLDYTDYTLEEATHYCQVAEEVVSAIVSKLSKDAGSESLARLELR